MTKIIVSLVCFLFSIAVSADYPIYRPTEVSASSDYWSFRANLGKEKRIESIALTIKGNSVLLPEDEIKSLEDPQLGKIEILRHVDIYSWALEHGENKAIVIYSLTIPFGEKSFGCEDEVNGVTYIYDIWNRLAISVDDQGEVTNVVLVSDEEQCMGFGS